MEMVLSPNLPEKMVCMAISDMKIEGINCIQPAEIPGLPSSMARHADLQICHLGGKFLLAAPEVYVYYKERLAPFGFEILCGETPIGSTYPKDAAYNIARVGNAAIHNPEITDPVTLRFFCDHGIKIIPVRQGYAKCMVLPVTENSLITADCGIAKKARENGFSVLTIQQGNIRLDGFSYGFLGGASGKIGKDTVYITGSLKKHPDFEKILCFLQERGIKIREGSIPIPIDIGSVLPLMTAKRCDCGRRE